MAAAQHKRSWKNLLINKRYQLRFTLFMVGTSTLLMVGLGIWVMKVARTSHLVAANDLFGAMSMECKDPRAVQPAAAPAAPATEEAAVAPAPTPEPEAAAATPTAADAAPSDGTAADAARTHEKPVVTIDSTMMPDLAPPAPAVRPAPAAPATPDPIAITRYEACKKRYDADLAELGRRKDHIVYALFITGALLVFGLTIYGIKMTHKVAGPLHKITTYLDKVRDGTYDEVFRLRKHDQLVEFYEHFRQAHAGLRKLQEDDIVRLRAMIQAAEQHDLAARSPELRAAIDGLRTILAKKEKSLA